MVTVKKNSGPPTIFSAVCYIGFQNFIYKFLKLLPNCTFYFSVTGALQEYTTALEEFAKTGSPPPPPELPATVSL